MATNGVFSKVLMQKTKQSQFDLSYMNAYNSRFGELLPIYVEDCLPGDRFRISAKQFVRLDPLQTPLFGSIYSTIHYFFVPYRIIWDNWEKFITGGRNGINQPEMPFLGYHTVFNRQNGRLLDFLSKTRNSSPGDNSTYIVPRVNMLDWRAYWKIYNDYYRDQNLEEDMFDPDGDAYIDTASDGDILTASGMPSNRTIDGKDIFMPGNRSYRKDLFTSALPWAQRGAQVTIPLGGSAPVVISGEFSINDNPLNRLRAVFPDQVSNGSQANWAVDANMTSGQFQAQPGNIANRIVGDGLGTGTADLSSATALSIEDLRNASALQRWLEHNAIGGARYKEQILMHFNEVVPDYRLDRPEYLGGVTNQVMTSAVMQTSQSSSDSALGDYAGQGIAAGSMIPRHYHVREHGVIMGIASITPEAIYTQGVPRRNLKFDKLDYFFPEFENLGEQEIYNNELFVRDSDVGNQTFGYGPRWYEYKQRVNEAHGDLSGNLSFWLPQRIFDSAPVLNQDFVHVNPDKEASLNNIFAVKSRDDYFPFNCVIDNQVRAIRKMSKFSHFSFY